MTLNLNYVIKNAVIWLSFLCLPILAKNKYNVSMLEMATCQEYDLRNTGYKYSDFFYVHTMNNNEIKNDELLHLKFYVLASMDAHVLLSNTDHPRLMDRVYEIGILKE